MEWNITGRESCSLIVYRRSLLGRKYIHYIDARDSNIIQSGLEWKLEQMGINIPIYIFITTELQMVDQEVEKARVSYLPFRTRCSP